MNRRSLPLRLAILLAPVALTLLFSTAILLMAGADPVQALGHLVGGAFESPGKLADVAVAMVPLLLCSAGMLVTFAAGLWNIGVEGQMIAGALMATWLINSLRAPSYVIIPLSIVAGLVGGALWGLLVRVLRTYGHVHEIFAGLGLNFVATALTNYLIFGPWKPPDGATMSGTDPFPVEAWMPSLGGTRASAITIILAIVGVAIIFVLLRNTYWGLKLKAIGLNPESARRLGVNNSLHMMLAFAVCGALAGLGGSAQATAVYHRLVPGISAGYGYLSQLVVLLSGLRTEWVPLVAAFFSIIQVGSLRLDLRLQLDSSLAGVLQAGLVFFFLLTRGLRQRLAERKE